MTKLDNFLKSDVKNSWHWRNIVEADLDIYKGELENVFSLTYDYFGDEIEFDEEMLEWVFAERLDCLISFAEYRGRLD